MTLPHDSSRETKLFSRLSPDQSSGNAANRCFSWHPYIFHAPIVPSYSLYCTDQSFCELDLFWIWGTSFAVHISWITHNFAFSTKRYHSGALLNLWPLTFLVHRQPSDKSARALWHAAGLQSCDGLNYIYHWIFLTTVWFFLLQNLLHQHLNLCSSQWRLSIPSYFPSHSFYS